MKSKTTIQCWGWLMIVLNQNQHWVYTQLSTHSWAENLLRIEYTRGHSIWAGSPIWADIAWNDRFFTIMTQINYKAWKYENIKTYHIYISNRFIIISEQALYITFSPIKQVCQPLFGQSSSVTSYFIYSITTNLLFVQKRIV